MRGGAAELVNPDAAAKNAAKLIDAFRQQGLLIVHVRHNYEPGGSIHQLVAPKSNEPVLSKDNVNAFKGTQLDSLLRSNNITELFLCGMQTHMCLEAATRAAADLGYKCQVVEDACATRDLSYNEEKIPAKYVHLSTLVTLRSYAKIITTEEVPDLL
ncbi:cysteine hydrolase family protein [Bacteroidota bacterium]